MIYSRLSTLAGKSHGRRSLVGYSPWSCEESDTTEWLHFHFSLSCIGEGNGNPLQCSCLENPRDRGAWWAAVYVVAQSWTRLKWLSSSSKPQVYGHLLQHQEETNACGYCGENSILLAQWKHEGFLVWVHCIRQKPETLVTSLGNISTYPPAGVQNFCD